MDRALFQKFYDDNIDYIAKKLAAANRDAGFYYVENKDGIYEEYLNQKTLLKTLIKEDDTLDRSLLDGHKIAACLTCSIIKVRLMRNRNINDDIDSAHEYKVCDAPRMNEQLAVLCGLSCVAEFMEMNPENLGEDGKTAQAKLILPKTFYPDRSEYLDSLIRALYYSNIYATINPLLLSNIYFLIDKNHRNEVELRTLRGMAANEGKDTVTTA